MVIARLVVFILLASVWEMGDGYIATNNDPAILVEAGRIWMDTVHVGNL